MNSDKHLALTNAVEANGGVISDEIRERFGLSKPGADEADSAPAPLVEIPEGFADLPWKQLQSLVKGVTGTGPESKLDAIAKLTEEVERRAAEADGNANGGDNGDA